ncbi:hypothetical protein NQU59_11865 [Acinetobacter colistiniresistens]|uniref:hypothetical protein n=1 Tax=Acinetobacter colistiniresistens TaxID=280145 RepID=UPI00211CCBEB|nr:hypothetical protein [Acinetobacter colistiniresistens]UUM26391.1 hypothetical protein NQU59_11865 [Acinetobacter colistiniresistens]
MNLIKNLFMFSISVVVISLVIILFDKFGMNKNFNLFFSAFLYSTFITMYFKKLLVSLLCFFAFYSMLFLLSNSLEVFLMFLTSISTLILIKTLTLKLKNDLRISTYKTDTF